MSFLSRFRRTRTAPAPPAPLPVDKGAADPSAAAAGLLDHPVFVAGRGRSGSSLLLRLFDGHPQVFAIPMESRLLTEIAPALRQTGDRKAAQDYLLSRFADFRAGEAQDAAVKRILIGVAALDPAAPDLGRALIRITLEALACARDPAGARCFLEKTPKNEEHFDEMFATFPQAKVIYLVRDPRAVYLSNKRSEAFRMAPDFAARQWVKSLRCVLRQVVKFAAAKRILVVRYEDLVCEAEATLGAICGFIGVDYHSALDRPTVYGNPWQGNAYGEAAAATYEIDPAKADDWRGRISAAESRAIIEEAQFEMSLLGYPIA